jgi:hypothetical protein
MKYMLIHCIDENAERNRKPQEYGQGSHAIEDWITKRRAVACAAAR